MSNKKQLEKDTKTLMEKIKNLSEGGSIDELYDAMLVDDSVGDDMKNLLEELKTNRLLGKIDPCTEFLQTLYKDYMSSYENINERGFILSPLMYNVETFEPEMRLIYNKEGKKEIYKISLTKVENE